MIGGTFAESAEADEKALIPTKQLDIRELLELIVSLSRSHGSVRSVNKGPAWNQSLSDMSGDVAYMIGELKQEIVIRMRRAERNADH